MGWGPRSGFVAAGLALLAALGFLHVRATTQSVDETGTAGELVYIGGANGVRPISFLDERGKLDGYDVDVLRSAQKYVRGYRFRFVPMEFTGLFAGINTGKLDLIVCSFAANPDRASRYLLSNGYVRKDSYLTVLAGDRRIRSLDDMGGRTVEAWSAASSDYPVFRAYNLRHPDKPIRIITSNGDAAIIVKNLVDGRTDAFSTTPSTLADLTATLGVKLKHVGPPTSVGFAHFLIRKDRTGLKREIDRAIALMAADGTLTRLSRKWWKRDYAPPAGADTRT